MGQVIACIAIPQTSCVLCNKSHSLSKCIDFKLLNAYFNFLLSIKTKNMICDFCRTCDKKHNIVYFCITTDEMIIIVTWPLTIIHKGTTNDTQ